MAQTMMAEHAKTIPRHFDFLRGKTKQNSCVYKAIIFMLDNNNHNNYNNNNLKKM